MQHDPLCCDPLDSESSGRKCEAGHDLVPPLHLVPCFLVEGGFRGQEVLNLASSCLHPQLTVPLQTFCNLAAEGSEEALVTRGILAHGDSCVDKPPHVCQDPRVLPCLLCIGLGYYPLEFCEESILFPRGGWGTEGSCPCLLLTLPCCSFWHGVLRSAPVPGKLSHWGGYHGCYPRDLIIHLK